MKEFLDVVDENGIPTGETVDRETAHSKGILHRTSHVWIFRKKNGKIQILLQKRCSSKKSFPGCYDISSAGHIPAGTDYITSALRELKEELGIESKPEELIKCGDITTIANDVFFGKEFHNREFSGIFILYKDVDEQHLTLQFEEVESVLWMDIDDCIESVKNNTIKHCIAIDELMTVKNAIEKYNISQ